MTDTASQKYPLQIAISSLFVVIVMTLGGILIWQSFNKTSEIILDSAESLYERITQELILDFNATYGSIAGALRQFRLSPVTRAATFDERSKHLAQFKAIFDSDPSVYGVGIGYRNGDYLGAHLINSAIKREQYRVPDGSTFIAVYIKQDLSEPGFMPGRRHIIYYDDELNEISRRGDELTEFDPRTRPWFQQAIDTPSTTKPYIFYNSKIVGLTAMSTTPDAGAVVMFDITLDNLARTITKHQVTPGSEVVLINADGQTFAYEHQDRVVVEKPDGGNNGELILADLDQLGSEVLSHVSQTIEAKEQDLEFEFSNRIWIGSTRVVARPGGVDLYALILSPVDELLAEVLSVRWQLIVIALLILLVFIPIIWFAARRISTPLQALSSEADSISRFDFQETAKRSSMIKEVNELESAMRLMKSTINRFLTLIRSLADEADIDKLVNLITNETMRASKSDAALIYVLDETDELLKPGCLCRQGDSDMTITRLDTLTIDEAQHAFDMTGEAKSRVINLDLQSVGMLVPLLDALDSDALSIVALPLNNRDAELIGVLCLVFGKDNRHIQHNSNIEFVQALSGFAAVTLESRQLIHMQEALLDAFIKLIAGAIDAKSPYTGGHCQRVPEITLMLAKAACESGDGKFRDFQLDDEQWKELGIACWLHDCGKVTTPEYVVDKSTKLETIYDRIHEVRMRFEVLKRDAEIETWKLIADGGDKDALLSKLDSQLKELDDDFAFIAECNVGGEFMADEKIDRLQRIAGKTWMRTLDDRLGISWEELNRKPEQQPALPVEEALLADKPEHLLTRSAADHYSEDNPWGFRVDTPEYKYNRGELYNLSVKKGTLSDEERYMIQSHMIQTIIMLNNLPYPRHLRNVPLIAGSHHETMDGKGYPKKLKMSEQPLTARMMVIADIFEALTAADRPYKKAKTLSESLRIMSFMRNDNHIDPDLFELFLSSGVYLEYAKKFLAPEQLDDVDITNYLSA